MERRLLRVASVVVLAGAGCGFVLGTGYLVQAFHGIGGRGYPGVLAAWALAVLAISASIVAFAAWTWRTAFNRAAVSLTGAALVFGYWALIYSGHDNATSIACGLVSALVLVVTAVASLSRVTLKNTD